MPRGGRRTGAGRPVGTTKGEGLPTKVVRVSADVPKELCDSIPGARDILNYWEDRVHADPVNPRYYYLKQMLDELRALGF